MSTRREFFRSLRWLSAGLFLPLACKGASSSNSPFGGKLAIQLWTLREMINHDLYETLKAVSEIGFSGIETYGFDGTFYGLPVEEFKNICRDLDLEIFSTHAAITAENANILAENAVEAGLKWIVLPSMMGRPHGTLDDYRKVAGELNQIGEICKQHGIRFGYHNHAFEFQKIDDTIPYNVLLDETGSDLVSFQNDLYWTVKAGFDPLDYFAAYPGRFGTLHIKDMSNTGESCIVGNGTIDFKTILKLWDEAGTGLLIYEQEHYDEGSPIYCAEQSIRYIHSHLPNL